MTEKVKTRKRIIYLDLLRIFAIFSMMVLHVAGGQWSSVAVNSAEWRAVNVYDSLVRFCVPVFVMISGTLFLDPERTFTIKIIFSKYILRIVTAFVFWSMQYAIVTNFMVYKKLDINVFKKIILDFIYGRYHLWFLFTIVGIYLIVPFLREICKKESLMIYFLALSLVFTFLVNGLKIFPFFNRTITVLESKTNLFFVLGYSGYFVLGYFLSYYQISKKIRKFIYIFGMIGVLGTIIGTQYIAQESGQAYQTLYGYLMPNVCLASVAVFVFFKEKFGEVELKEKIEDALCSVSNLSFGMYLVHDFFNILLQRLKIQKFLLHTIFSIPVVSIFVFFLSMLAAHLISKVKILRKYIM